ncbi:MAG: hypothetical protein E2O68_09295 [Deltaproteobacteria bacterium]|nr:MAG: hypothetical protein E2O68_09295 [Deltaproteobacteria bacterium]
MKTLTIIYLLMFSLTIKAGPIKFNIVNSVDLITELPFKKEQTPEFKFFHMQEQAYWYSLYSLGAFIMKSGLGEKFMPNMAMVKKMVQMASDEHSTAMPAKNPALLKRVYNYGNPRYINANNGDPSDFNNGRWAHGYNDPTTGKTFGWTLMKEIEWTKQFNLDNHFGDPGHNNIPGAQQRFAGLVLCAEALMQIKDYKMNPGNYKNSHRSDEYVVLSAISNLAGFIGTPSSSKMRENRCAKVASMMQMKPASEVSKDLLNMAKGIFQNMPEPVITKDRSLAIQALAWYGLANKKDRPVIKAKIKEHADELVAWTSQNIMNQAYKIRALIGAANITGDNGYKDVAVAYYHRMMDDFMPSMGVFIDKMSFTADEVAVLLGAFNAIKIFAAMDVGADKLAKDMTSFFLNVVNKSGLQISAPPISSIPAYKRKPSPMFHRYPTIPLPPMAGGPNGTAPVFARKVSLIFNHWVVDETFDTAGAMHLSNEMIWFHHDQVNGFPKW